MDDHDERVRQRAYKIWIRGPPRRTRRNSLGDGWGIGGDSGEFLNAPKPAPAGGAKSRAGEPIEESFVAANTAEIPTATDQGEQVYHHHVRISGE